mgnify:CR=1 FL=1
MLTSVIRNRFVFGPPLLSSVLKPFTGHEHMFKLVELAGQYLPGENASLLNLAPAAAAKRFIESFSKSHFPIADRSHGGNPLSSLVDSIIVELLGISSTHYEPSPWRKLPPGQLLAEALCACPFTRRDASRLPVIDTVKKLLGEDAGAILGLIPEGGYTLGQIEAALKDSPYPGLLARCRWLFSRTGNIWLDKQGYRLPWTRLNVKRLTVDYPASLELKKQMDSFESWLGHAPGKKYAEVIRYVKSEISKTLMEVFHGEVKAGD